eukprot:1159762-Pelagomonas_calceolata.AAC.1
MSRTARPALAAAAPKGPASHHKQQEMPEILHSMASKRKASGSVHPACCWFILPQSGFQGKLGANEEIYG